MLISTATSLVDIEGKIEVIERRKGDPRGKKYFAWENMVFAATKKTLDRFFRIYIRRAKWRID